MAPPIADVQPADLGQWLLTLAAVLGIVALVLSIIGSWKRITRQSAEGERFITHAEFVQMEHAIRRRIHGLANAMQSIRLDLAQQPQRMRELIDEANRPKLRQLARISAAVIAICVKLEVEPPKTDDS